MKEWVPSLTFNDQILQSNAMKFFCEYIESILLELLALSPESLLSPLNQVSWSKVQEMRLCTDVYVCVPYKLILNCSHCR